MGAVIPFGPEMGWMGIDRNTVEVITLRADDIRPNVAARCNSQRIRR